MCQSPESPDTEATKALVEHYQKTYELTYNLWRQRNRTFLILLGVIGGATLLTFRIPDTEPFLVDVIAKLIGITDDARIGQLRAGFPFGLIQSIILAVVFYLVVNLYHRAGYVLRNYKYLAGLEREIRDRLRLGPNTVGFTRESTFYWSDRSPLGGAVKWTYIGLLGIVLLAFLVGRAVEDFGDGNIVLALADVGMAIPTLVFYAEYARISVTQDSAEAIVANRTQ
jgi:hypothetical protein